jgi:hypothetical protein
MVRPMAAQEPKADVNEPLMEVLALKRRAADLKRRHERIVESVASFPNTVNERRERDLAAGRADVEARIAALEQQLTAQGLKP